MNSRQRVLAALRGEPVGRLPWIPLCSPTYSAGLAGSRQAYAKRTGRSLGFDPESRVLEEMLPNLAFRVELYRHP